MEYVNLLLDILSQPIIDVNAYVRVETDTTTEFPEFEVVVPTAREYAGLTGDKSVYDTYPYKYFQVSYLEVGGNFQAGGLQKINVVYHSEKC